MGRQCGVSKRLQLDSEALQCLMGRKRRATKQTEVFWPYISRIARVKRDESVFKKINVL